MKLIDADELSGRMYHEAFETDSKMQKWDSGCWIRYKMFENAIESTQPIKLTPCDLCKYNPPSSMDGKPCTMCPAEEMIT